ncbi:MAG: hypothetical protein MRJ65_02895 [Candidatus Brocadiaceae bacterium]|nr:hypothetical protein [Candidatus Brocadiaceae bacterium]
MKNCLLVKILAVFLLLYFLPEADATSTETWMQSTASDFELGSIQNTSIHSTGEVRLSPKTETVTGINNSFVWTMTMDSQNQVFIGTGDSGTVYLLKDGSDAIEIFKSPEIYIQSLISDNQGNIYAGTAPRGIIYKITPQGEAVEFCTLPVSYIWDMIIDSNANLFAATGGEGILFKISPEGIPSVFFDSPETNILDLLLDQSDNVYAGTEPNGLLYKISPSREIRVLYDAEEDEIHCLEKDVQGNIYAGTASGATTKMPAAQNVQPVAQANTVAAAFKEEKSWDLNIPEGLTMSKTISTKSRRFKPRKQVPSAKLAGGVPTQTNYVYKITQEGIAEKIFEASQAFIFSIAIDAQENLYVVTGNNPGVYKVYKDMTSSSLMEPEEEQALCCLLTGDNELFVGMGNTGKVYKIFPAYVREGSFLSNVFDTTTSSSWGRIFWTGVLSEGAFITLATRTGNCENPDSAWSEWSNPYTLPWERITSPPARFIQYKAVLQTTFPDRTPVLSTVAISYLPENLSPEIIDFFVEKESSASRLKDSRNKVESKPQSSHNQKKHHQIAQKNIQWEVEDPNNDAVLLTLFYRGIDEKVWQVMDKNKQSKGSYAWDTLRLPDGEYQIKLLVSDEPDNPPGTAFSVEKIIQSVLIDNSRPAISSLSVVKRPDGNYEICGIIHDKYSRIIRVQYTIDGEKWISASPEDGIFDGLEEAFRITTGPLRAGEYTFIINAFDDEQNIGIEKVLLTVK